MKDKLTLKKEFIQKIKKNQDVKSFYFDFSEDIFYESDFYISSFPEDNIKANILYSLIREKSSSSFSSSSNSYSSKSSDSKSSISSSRSLSSSFNSDSSISSSISSSSLSISSLSSSVNSSLSSNSESSSSENINVIRENLLAYWNFDGDQDAALNDYSGNELNLINFEKSCSRSEGLIEKSLFFQRTENPSRLSPIDQNKILNFSHLNKFSFSFWMKTDRYKMYEQGLNIFECFDGKAGYILKTDERTPGLKFLFAGEFRGRQIINRISIQNLNIFNFNWNHIAFTFDGGNYGNEARFFINGIEQTISEYANPLAASIQSKSVKENFKIGSSYWGFLDEFSIWGEVLSQEKILKLYNNGKSLSLKLDTYNILTESSKSSYSSNSSLSKSSISSSYSSYSSSSNSSKSDSSSKNSLSSYSSKSSISSSDSSSSFSSSSISSSFSSDSSNSSLSSVSSSISSSISSRSSESSSNSSSSSKDYLIEILRSNQGLNLFGNIIYYNNTYYEASSFIEFEENSANFLGNEDEFTFIINGGKIKKEYIYNISNKKENILKLKCLHDREILFNNIKDDGLGNYSGWEIGLNSANMLYLHSASNGYNEILTYSKDRPSGENIWVIKLYGKELEISRFDNEKNKFITQRFSLKNKIVNGGVWKINRSDWPKLKTFNSEISRAETSSVHLKSFFYINQILSETDMYEFIKKLGGEASFEVDTQFKIPIFISSQNILTDSIYQVDDIILNKTGQFTHEEEFISGFEYQNIYGDVNTYEEYLIEKSSGIYYKDIWTGAQELKITGYIKTPITGKILNQVDFFEQKTTGIIKSGIKNELNISIEYINQTGEQILRFDEEYTNLNYNTISFVDYVKDTDFIEIIKTNKYSNVNNILSQQNEPIFYIDKEDWDKNIDIYLNGMRLIKDKDVFIDEVGNLKFHRTKSLISNTSNWLVYDIYNEEVNEKELDITLTGQYNFFNLFNQISQENGNYFFNGIKIYEDIDFIKTESGFIINEDYKKMIGIYNSFKKNNEWGFFTGNKSEALRFLNEEIKNLNIEYYIIYVNGLRMCTKEMIKHDNNVDLIEDVYLFSRRMIDLEDTEEIKGGFSI